MKCNVTVSFIILSLLLGKDQRINGDPEVRYTIGSSDNTRNMSRRDVRNDRDVADTLVYPLDYGSQFIMSPGDAMMTVFQMPADGYIRGVNIPIAEWGTGDQQLTVSLHEMSYPYGADGTMYPMSTVDGDGWIGGYDMNDSGWVTIEGENYTPGGTEGICNPNDVVVANACDPFEDTGYFPPTPLIPNGLIWPDGFTAATLDPTNNPAPTDNWIATADFGTEPFLTAGTWVGILVQSTGEGGGDDDATGFYYASGIGHVDPWASLKFYHACSGTSGNGGWHIRHWVFDFELAVVLTGDRGPIFQNYTSLNTTVSTDDIPVEANITDDNPSGGDAGVATASLFYMLDSLSADTNEVTLTLASGSSEEGTWSGTIPGQEQGSLVYYYFTATDVNGNVTTAVPILSYYIFQPLSSTLFFYNGIFSDWEIGPPFPWPVYPYGIDGDVWSANYGNLLPELVEHYSHIIEMQGRGGPLFNTDTLFSEWYTENKTLIVCGDEWLGMRYGWPSVPLPIPNGDFVKDVMGVDTYYPDITYSNNTDAISRFRVNPEDSIISPLAQFLDDTLYLNYDPDYETGEANWLDGVDPVAGYNIALEAYEGVIANPADPDPQTPLHSTMIWRKTGENAGVAFLTFDPIGLNTGPSYYWIGFPDNNGMALSPLYLAYIYFTGNVGIDDGVPVPRKLYLYQNYPNPFNPVTTIRYDLPEQTHVRLTVVDLLGREVIALIDREQSPGIKEVRLDATNLSSGMYFYSLSTTQQQISKKLVVLK